MGFFDNLFGSKPAPQEPPRNTPEPTEDERAVARYRYLLRTAPPEAIEQAHTEAFAQLTPQQRAEVLRQLSTALPAAEQSASGTAPEPQALARMAMRAELRQPGLLERVLGPRSLGPSYGYAPGGGVGLGGMMAGSLFSSIAGSFIGSAIAHELLDGFDHSPEAHPMFGSDDSSQALVDQYQSHEPDHHDLADADQDSSDHDAESSVAQEDLEGDGDFGDAGDFGDDFEV